MGKSNTTIRFGGSDVIMKKFGSTIALMYGDKITAGGRDWFALNNLLVVGFDEDTLFIRDCAGEVRPASDAEVSPEQPEQPAQRCDCDPWFWMSLGFVLGLLL